MIHLHVHSNFSFLDGASPPDRLLQRASELGMPALALTDHHGLYGVVRFIQAANAYGIKPIIGAEICLHAENKPHLILLAKDRHGYANLCRIITKAQLDYQDDPQISLSDLAVHREGLIALSGSRRGEIAAHLLAGRQDRARSAADRYLEIFGEDFWIELEHHLLPDDTELVEALLDLASHAHLPYVIANDVHYAYPDEYRLRDVMACIQTHTTLDEWHEVRHTNAEYYLKSRDELRGTFDFLPATVFEAGVAATEQIASACQLKLLAASSRPPDFPVPEGETAFSHLYQLCQEGARRLYRPLTPRVSNQLAHELATIETMGLASFFLCVWDIVNFARKKGIRCAGRGSAADSIVAYVLGITAVDPLAHNLLFERFLNPGRMEMPDVDIDFDSRRRDEVIAYILDKYGTEHAAMVANVVTYRSRSAFRDVAKALGLSPSLIDHLASRLPFIKDEDSSPPLSLRGRGGAYKDEGLEESKRLEEGGGRPRGGEETGVLEGERGRPQGPPLPGVVGAGGRLVETRGIATGGEATGWNPLQVGEGGGGVRAILDLCRQLEGYPRHLSLHNGGILITAEPLTDVVPLEYATSGVRVCQFNKDDVEVLGLIKFDILGLRTLSIVDESVRLIRERRGIELTIDDLSLDDTAIYDLICSSRTIGVFQIESPGQWALLARAQPRSFADLIIQIALFRPGPLQGGMVNPYIERRLGREEVTYPHPSLEKCLKDTLGVVIFQEQVLEVAHEFAGLSYADADRLRRAISHYRTEVEMNACREDFVESAVRIGRDRALAERIYEMIAYFSGYGFCRSHAAAFAKIVYQTAFLKTYYPAEFLAAILSNEPCCYYPTQTVIEEARKWGLRVLPVDINRSKARYLPEWQAIRMGLMQVKGLSEETAEAIVIARGKRPFTSLRDFWQRTSLDRDAVEHLIAVGAFDRLGVNRRKLLWQLEEIARTVPRGQEMKTAPLMAGSSLPPNLPPLTQLDIAGLDFTLQGASAQYSIMAFYREALLRVGILSIGQLQGKEVGSLVRTAGVVVSRQHPPTAHGMTFLVLTDEEGELPVAVDPGVYAQHRQIVHGSAALVVEGRIQRVRYLTSLVATRLWRLNDTATLDTKPHPRPRPLPMR